MNIDSFLKIGYSHTMCQDYILSGHITLGTDNFSYIILADGCSQAINSDMGARFLCYEALSFLISNIEHLNDIDWYRLGKEVIFNASNLLNTKFPTLNIECLDATLIVAYKYNGVYKIFMYGDGVIYSISPDGNIAYYKHSFEPNAPAYLRYLVKGKELYSNKIELVVEYQNQLLDISGKQRLSDPFTSAFIELKEEEVKTLIIASDGIESLIFKDEALYKTKFLNLDNAVKHMRNINLTGFDQSSLIPKVKELNYLDILKETTDFKLTKGPFLSRRIKKVLKEYLKNGFVNDDDISIGCFYEG